MSTFWNCGKCAALNLNRTVCWNCKHLHKEKVKRKKKVKVGA